MACCVIMAALFGGVSLIKAMFILAPRKGGNAQDWRFTD